MDKSTVLVRIVSVLLLAFLTTTTTLGMTPEEHKLVARATLARVGNLDALQRQARAMGIPIEILLAEEAAARATGASSSADTPASASTHKTAIGDCFARFIESGCKTAYHLSKPAHAREIAPTTTPSSPTEPVSGPSPSDHLPGASAPAGASAKTITPPATEDDKCSICLAPLGTDESVVLRLSCGHAFHTGCIDNWLQHQSFCPTCTQSPNTGILQFFHHIINWRLHYHLSHATQFKIMSISVSLAGSSGASIVENIITRVKDNEKSALIFFRSVLLFEFLGSVGAAFMAVLPSHSTTTEKILAGTSSITIALIQRLLFNKLHALWM